MHYLNTIDRMSRGDRQKWDYFMNMRYDEYKHYETFFNDKRREVNQMYKGKKTYEELMVNQLGVLIER